MRLQLEFYSLKYLVRQWMRDHNLSLEAFAGLEAQLRLVADEENQ